MISIPRHCYILTHNLTGYLYVNFSFSSSSSSLSFALQHYYTINLVIIFFYLFITDFLFSFYSIYKLSRFRMLLHKNVSHKLFIFFCFQITLAYFSRPKTLHKHYTTIAERLLSSFCGINLHGLFSPIYILPSIIF